MGNYFFLRNLNLLKTVSISLILTEEYSSKIIE